IRTDTLVAVVGNALEGVFPGDANGSFDLKRFGRPRIALLDGAVFQQFHEHRDLGPKLNDVANLKTALAFSQADAVKEGAVGAIQVLQWPAAFGGPDLGMAAAYGRVIEGNLQRFQPANAEECLRFPGLPLGFAVNAPQADPPFHNRLPWYATFRLRPGSLPC